MPTGIMGGMRSFPSSTKRSRITLWTLTWVASNANLVVLVPEVWRAIRQASASSKPDDLYDVMTPGIRPFHVLYLSLASRMKRQTKWMKW